MTLSNQELTELVQILEQKVTELQGKIVMLENDLDDIDNRSNNLIAHVVVKSDWNDGLEILKRIGALNKVDIRRGYL